MKFERHQHKYKSSIWRQRLALAFALLVVLRVVAWDLHHAHQAHSADETCEVCLVFERNVDGMPSKCGKPALQRVSVLPVVRQATLPGAEPHASPLPRGPPSIQS